MTVEVTFAGVDYSIPEEDDSGWADLTSYLVALSGASVGTVETKSGRVATATPVTISATDDYAIGVNFAGASAVTLPAGSDGRILIIYDASGTASTNKITITGTGGQLINGRATYVIRSNYGAVQLQFQTSGWAVLSSREITVEQNATNKSVVDMAPAVANDGVSVNDGQACTFTFGSNAARFLIEADGTSLECACGKTNNSVDCLWDTDNLFLSSDAGSGIVVTKSSNVVTIKSRLGSASTIFVKILYGQVLSATAWS
jgi:hypothetical protein